MKTVIIIAVHCFTVNVLFYWEAPSTRRSSSSVIINAALHGAKSGDCFSHFVFFLGLLMDKGTKCVNLVCLGAGCLTC